MGFLDGVAMRSEQKRLQPFFRSDEHFLETDVCDLVAISNRQTGERGRGGQVVLTLTSRALYFRAAKGGGDVIRIPYERILDARGVPGTIEVITSLSRYVFRDSGRAMRGNKLSTLSVNVRRYENYRATVPVQGGEILAINRPVDEGKAPVWILTPTPGVDINDRAVRRVLEHHLSDPILRYGALGF